MADVVALVTDLLFQSKLRETARLVGVEIQTVSAGADLVAAAKQHPAALVIVDLGVPRGALEALEQVCAADNSRPVIAFLSHVERELAERARAAGCRQVLARSQFTRDLPAILAQAKKPRME